MLESPDMSVRPLSAKISALVPPEFKDCPWYHFSVDDVFDSLIDVTLREIPLFSHPFFALMKEVHDEYGVQVDLELFWEKEIDGIFYSLEDVRDLTHEISSEGSWLRFGPHAHGYMVAPFEQFPAEQQKVFDQIYNQIRRFAGVQFCAQWVRLHYYSESYELASYFKTKGVTALFSTDKEVGSHRMPSEISSALIADGIACFEDMNFIRTQFRVEVFTNQRNTEEDIKLIFQESLKRYGFIIIYSHEYEFARSEVRNMFRRVFKVLRTLELESIQQPLANLS